MTYMYGDGMVAISSSRYFRDVVGKSIFVIGRGTGSTANYLLDVAYEASWLLYHVSGLNDVTEFRYLSSQSVGLAPSDEHQLVIHDSVGDGMCCGYGVDISAVKIISGRCSPAVHGCASSAETCQLIVAVAVRSEAPKPDT